MCCWISVTMSVCMSVPLGTIFLQQHKYMHKEFFLWKNLSFFISPKVLIAKYKMCKTNNLQTIVPVENS